MGRPKNATKPESQFKDEYAEVIRLLKKGYSVKAVAQLQGISPTTVMKVKKMFIIKSVEKRSTKSLTHQAQTMIVVQFGATQTHQKRQPIML